MIDLERITHRECVRGWDCGASGWPALIAVVVAMFAPACGYAALAVDRRPSQRFCVVGAPSSSADAVAAAALEAGVRQWLMRFGALGACGDDQRVVVSLQAITSEPEGIIAVDGSPSARGVRLTAVALATLAGSSETWRVEGQATVGSSGATWTEAQVQSDGRSLAAKRAGERLGRRLLGEPVSGP